MGGDDEGSECNARFPHGPSDLAFTLNLCGSILNTTGPALRDLAGREQEDKGDQAEARLRPGTEWFVTLASGKEGSPAGLLAISST